MKSIQSYSLLLLVALFALASLFGCSKDSSEGSDSPKSGIIKFKDDKARAICVSNFDRDGDSELSYAEAAAVTDEAFNKVYFHDVKYFDELQYFTGVTNLYRFTSNTSLESFSIPKNVTWVDFTYFQNLKSIHCYAPEAPDGPVQAGFGGWFAIFYKAFYKDGLKYKAEPNDCVLYVPKAYYQKYYDDFMKHSGKWYVYVDINEEFLSKRLKTF